jgi:hypothetical protein
MAHRFLTVPLHLSGTVPCVELPSGRGCLPLTVVHDVQRDAQARGFRALGPSWPMHIFSICFLAILGCRRDHSRSVRLRTPTSLAKAAKLVESSCSQSAPRATSASLPMPPGSLVLFLQSLCHLPFMSPHRCANGRVGERVGGRARWY